MARLFTSSRLPADDQRIPAANSRLRLDRLRRVLDELRLIKKESCGEFRKFAALALRASCNCVCRAFRRTTQNSTGVTPGLWGRVDEPWLVLGCSGKRCSIS